MIVRATWLMAVVVILFAWVGLSSGEAGPPAYTPAQLGAIRETQIRVSENRHALRDGDISRSAAEARIARNMARLNAGLPCKLTETTLMAIDIPDVMPGMTRSERKAGFFAGISFLRLGLIAVFTALTMLLIGKHMLKVLGNFSKELWEIGTYLSGIGVLVAQAVGYLAINQFCRILFGTDWFMTFFYSLIPSVGKNL